MSVKRVKNHGAWVWRARVSYQGKQRARFCDSKQAAEDAVPATSLK